MGGPEVERQVERSRQRLTQLRERAVREGHGPDSPLQEAVEELGQTLEELSVALEELTFTNEELAEANLAAEAHARRYLDLFHQAPDACLVTDERGVIRELNVVAAEKLGCPARHLVGKPLLPLVVEDDRDAFLAALAALREPRGRLEDRLLRFGSDPGLYASVSAVPEPRDAGLEIRWMLRDVSDFRERDAVHHEIERHLEAVVWLQQLDPLRTLHVSPAYEAIWGRPLASLYENPGGWTEPVHPEDRPRVEAAFERMRGGEPFDEEYRILRADGEVRWVHDRGAPLPDAAGRPHRAAGIAEDVTERRRAAAQLGRAVARRRAAAAAAERAEAQERRSLASDLHDSVSQSLALARTKLSALRHELREPDQVAALRGIESLVAEADERTRTLTFRLSPPILHDLGLVPAAEWLAEDLENRFGLDVRVVDDGLQESFSPEVREALFRSLRELLINVARHAETDEAKVTLSRGGDSATITVEDGGVGFDVGRAGASGFGLTSIRERLEALGGRLEIDSNAGRGTRAHLTVPTPPAE